LGCAMGQEENEQFDLAAVGRRLKSEFGVQGAPVPSAMQTLLTKLALSEREQEDKTAEVAQ